MANGSIESAVCKHFPRAFYSRARENSVGGKSEMCVNGYVVENFPACGTKITKPAEKNYRNLNFAHTTIISI